MAANTMIATDSATELRDLIGHDSTTTFEDDPTFVNANPGTDGSSENIEEQRDTEDLEENDEDEDDAEEDGDVDEDEGEDEEEEDGEDEDEDVDEDDELEDEDDEEEEDDAEEAAASSPALRADGLLGYEDEAEDVAQKRDREHGDAARQLETTPKTSAKHLERATDTEGDDDEGDMDRGVDEETLGQDDMDTDRVTADAFAASRISAILAQYGA